MSAAAKIYPQGRVTLREVGLRDGLQLVKRWPDTDQKIEWLKAEHAAGVRHFEIGSFLPQKHFPQFADVGVMVDVVAGLQPAYSAALTLNERGALDALQTEIDELVCVVSATEEHSRANVRRTRQEAIQLVSRVAELRSQLAQNKIVNVGISMAFGCSIAGAVEQKEITRLVERCLEGGADVIGLADTVGYAGPKQVGELVSAVRKISGERPLIVHLHDTRGMAIANASAALDAGANVLDGSLGGLGGCPFAPGATGNVVFEDLVYLCETMGFTTDINLETLTVARDIAARSMPGEKFHGALARSGAPTNMEWRAA